MFPLQVSGAGVSEARPAVPCEGSAEDCSHSILHSDNSARAAILTTVIQLPSAAIMSTGPGENASFPADLHTPAAAAACGLVKLPAVHPQAVWLHFYTEN